MAQLNRYEIEVDSQDEFYEENDSNMQPPQNIVRPVPESSATSSDRVRSVVRRKGRGFSTEEPSTQVLGGIKHFDSIREEVSGRALRCKTIETFET